LIGLFATAPGEAGLDIVTVCAAASMYFAVPGRGPAPYVTAPEKAGAVTAPEWICEPKLRHVRAAYRSVGGPIRGGGRVTLNCVVTVWGTLEACEVRSEQPAGKRLAQAALDLSRSYQLKPRTADGAWIAGSRVTINVRFAAAED
jgi:hypothetical protein